VRLPTCLFSQAQCVFIVEHYLQSQTYLKCQDEFRSAFPKSQVLRLEALFRGTGVVSDRKRYGRATVLNDVSVENILLSLVQSPRKLKFSKKNFNYIETFFKNDGCATFDHPV
jgi:hypothetical protein